MNALFAVASAFETAAVEVTRHLRKRSLPRPRPRGATLRPGVETPLWLALVALTEPQLRKHGAKALLARELAVDRSRVTEFFVKKSAMPDAERSARSTFDGMLPGERSA